MSLKGWRPSSSGEAEQFKRKVQRLWVDGSLANFNHVVRQAAEDISFDTSSGRSRLGAARPGYLREAIERSKAAVDVQEKRVARAAERRARRKWKAEQQLRRGNVRRMQRTTAGC